MQPRAQTEFCHGENARKGAAVRVCERERHTETERERRGVAGGGRRLTMERMLKQELTERRLQMALTERTQKRPLTAAALNQPFRAKAEKNPFTQLYAWKNETEMTNAVM